MIQNPYIGKEYDGVEMVEEIGRGGMGVVMRGVRKSDGAGMAVKLLPQSESKDAQYISRFEREAKILIQLRHPNILRVESMGHGEDGTYYIIMEFIDGFSLGDVIKNVGRMPAEQAAGIVMNTAKALQAGQAQSIIHRDIKPDNILLTRDGQVKLADFGLAKDTSDNVKLTITGQVMGTPAFMSPEQGKGEKVDHRSDIYSLGVTFYYMLAGQRPFAGTTPLEIVVKQIKDDPQPLQEIIPDLPESLYNLISRMIKKEPEDRQQTHQEVVDEIVAIADEAGWDLSKMEAGSSEEDLDLTLDSGGLGNIVQQAIEQDRTQMTADPNEAFAAEKVDTGEIIGDQADSRVGKTIGGKYVIRSKLGEGGMGAVFLVRHADLDQDFALKVLNPELAANPSFQERFLREAKAATAFTHKHAIQIRDFGHDGDLVYMTMDFSRGKTLKDILEAQGSISEQRTATITQQILAALREAHAAGLIHRDLKPENVMIEYRSGQDFVRILDFGVAKLMGAGDEEGGGEASTLTRTGTVVGTIQYMSPEQASGSSDIDMRSDLYSLATIMYECLTGGRHIEADNMQQMMFKLATEDPVPIVKRVKGISKKFEQLVMRNLSRDREKRSASAAEFMGELEACSDHLHSTIAIKREGSGLLIPLVVGAVVIVALVVGGILIATSSKSGDGESGKPGPVTPGPSPEDLDKKKKEEYAKFIGLGKKAYQEKKWQAALENFQAAKERRLTEEVDKWIKKSKWEIEMVAYLDFREKKDYMEALGRVSYGLAENSTTVEQGQTADRLKAELNALLKDADETYQKAKRFDEAGETLQAIPHYGKYVAAFPKGKHFAFCQERYQKLLSEAKSFNGLLVESNPPEAEVYLDGIFIGKTPCMYGEITGGVHTLSVDLKGFLPMKKEISYEKGKRLTITAKLDKEKFGALRIVAKGQDVTVRFKGRVLGQTPVTVDKAKVGEVKIEIVGPVNETYTVSTRVLDGKTTRIEVDLDELHREEKKAFNSLIRGKTLAETVDVHKNFLKAYPGGQYASRCRKTIANLTDEEDDYKACTQSKSQDRELKACQNYLSRHRDKTYPYGWYVEKVTKRVSKIRSTKEQAAYAAILTKTTFYGRRLSADKYIDGFPSGKHLRKVKKIRDNTMEEEKLYNFFANADSFGRKLTYGRQYAKKFAKGLKIAEVAKAVSDMTISEKKSFGAILKLKDVAEMIRQTRAHLVNYPGGDNQKAVEERMKKAETEKIAFDRTEQSADLCRTYLKTYPKGWYVKTVEMRLQRFGWTDSTLGEKTLKGKTPEGLSRGEKPGEYKNKWDDSVMVYVPPGFFPLGTNDYYGEDEDRPEVMTFISGFFIDKYEVTNARYKVFLDWMKAAPNPRKFEHPNQPKGKSHTPSFWSDSRFNRPDQPVVGVDWYDAWAYARWSGKLLPTEAQWEKAAAANIKKNTKTRYPWGDSVPTKGLCNFDGLAKGTVAANAHPKGASLFGVEQMAGNVAEWCLDPFSNDFLSALKKKYPGGKGRWAINPRNTGVASLHTIRGGDWDQDADDLVVTRRRGFKGRSNLVGFRCALWQVEKK